MANTHKSSALKTSEDCCTVMPGVIIKPLSRRSQQPMFQCLQAGSGQTPAWCEGEALISLGLSKTPPNITECHSEESVCTLSQILQADVPPKYSLSPKACRGILRRAHARGKALPPMLQTALETRAAELA